MQPTQSDSNRTKHIPLWPRHMLHSTQQKVKNSNNILKAIQVRNDNCLISQKIVIYNNLTMYRPQNESRYYESTHHEENPFFRETITIIDECTKLMKEDRIFLRNRIKDYLKELKENRHRQDDWEHEQIQILLQIFVQANRKKSLNKIQKGDKVMDWLQIKLRKFIDNNKKERHRKEVETFRRMKALNSRKQLQSHIYLEKSLQKSREFPVSNGHKFIDQINKLSFNLEANKKSTIPKYSLGKSNEKQPDESRRKFSRKQPTSNLSFYKQFDYLKKSASKERQPVRSTASSLLKNKFTYHESRPMTSHSEKFNKSIDSHHKSVENRKMDRSKQKIQENFYKNKNFKERPIQSELNQNQIDKLTQLFTHHLNSQDKTKRNAESSQNQKQIQFLFPEQNSKQDTLKPSSRVPSEPTSDRQANFSNNSPNYESSHKKLQYMLNNSKQIQSQFQQHYQDMPIKFPSLDPIPLSREFAVQKSLSNQNLFTPPDFLAECKKFMFSSNKKKTEQDVFAYYQTEEKNREPYRQTTFSDILNESKQKTFERPYRLNHFGINETISQNASANISTNKPQSQVHFQYRNNSVTTIELLLKQIFKNSHKATLDRFQLGQIMSKCNPETEQLFQKYCDVLSLQSNSFKERLSFDFVATVKYFFTFGKILQSHQDYFCRFLTQILDMRKKGFIEEDDLQNFFQSLEQQKLDPSILNPINSLLSYIFKLSCEIQGSRIATHWSIYYLELKEDHQLLQLKQLLDKFEFQLEKQ